MRNPNPNVQLGSGYWQTDFLQKFRYRLPQNWELSANLQYSNSSAIPRYDQLSEGTIRIQNDRIVAQDLRFAQWDYGPQQRLFSSLQAEHKVKDNPLFDRLRMVAAYQDIHEIRITRRFGRSFRNKQKEQLDILTLNVDFTKNGQKGRRLVYGLELRQNWVQSQATSLNIESGERSDSGLGTRYPDGGSQTRSAAAYAQYRLPLSSKLQLIAGGRLNWSQVQARFLDTALYSLPFDAINVQANALTGSAGVIWDMAQAWKLHSSLSNAFRSPNVDDVGKIRAKGGTVTVPNAALQPEQSLNGELRLRYQQQKQLRIQLTEFYTYLFDAIVQAPFRLNGEDSLFYDGRYEQIVANVNTGRAQVWGLSSQLTWEPNAAWTFESTLFYQRGRDLSTASPLAHIPPLYGRSSLRYQHKAFRGRLAVLYNGAKPLSIQRVVLII